MIVRIHVARTRARYRQRTREVRLRPQFTVRLVTKNPITLMDGMWPEDRQRALLEELLEEPTELTGPDLTEMLELALQDLEPVECGMKLLQVLMGDTMTKGMRDTVARDMLEAQPWVEHSHMNWHRSIYEAAWLARAAHGSSFTRPHGLKLTFNIEALDDDANALLDTPILPALAMRLVAPCAPDALLWRLFEDQLGDETFAEAPSIAWFAQWSGRERRSATLTIEGSDHWWSSFNPGESIPVDAWPDAVDED